MDNSEKMLAVLIEIRDMARREEERNKNLVRFLYAFAAAGAMIIVIALIALGYVLNEFREVILNAPPPEL